MSAATISLAVSLRKLGACSEAVTWAKNYDSFQVAWAVCERPDWMLWLVGKMADKKSWPKQELRKKGFLQ